MKNFLWAVGSVIVAVVLGLFVNGPTSLGAITSPPSNLDYLQISQAIGWLTSGIATPINETVVRTALTAATTTPCSIQNPFSATSTLTALEINITTATSSAGQLVFATSSTAFGTTTGSFGKYSVAANVQQTVSFGGNASTTGQAPVVAPSGWANIGMDVGSAVTYGYTYGGTCSAKFTSVN